MQRIIILQQQRPVDTLLSLKTNAIDPSPALSSVTFTLTFSFFSSSWRWSRSKAAQGRNKGIMCEREQARVLGSKKFLEETHLAVFARSRTETQNRQKNRGDAQTERQREVEKIFAVFSGSRDNPFIPFNLFRKYNIWKKIKLYLCMDGCMYVCMHACIMYVSCMYACMHRASLGP